MATVWIWAIANLFLFLSRVRYKYITTHDVRTFSKEGVNISSTWHELFDFVNDIFILSFFLSDPVKQHPSLFARPQFVAGRAVIVPTTLQRCATGQEEVLWGVGYTLPVNLVSSSPLWCCKPAKKFHNISLNLIQVIMFRSKRLVCISLASPASVFGVLSRNPLSDLILCLSGAIVWGTCNQWLNGLAAECKNKQQIWVPGTRRSGWGQRGRAGNGNNHITVWVNDLDEHLFKNSRN